MHKHRREVYLAYSCPPEDTLSTVPDAGDYMAATRPEEAAEYIAALLSSLRAIASKSQFQLLADLLYVAEEEARLHYRR